MRFPQVRGRLRGRRSRVLVLLGLLGPGLIAANAANDAGGIATYSEVGAKYGYTLLWAMLLITISLALVQRSAARMGAVTGKGLAELIREGYGIRWSAFATLCVLVANFGICISDFVGVGAALGLAGVPVQLSVPIAALGIWLIIVRGSYRSAERVFIWLTIPFFAYPVAAILAHPDWGKVGHALVVPQLHTSSTFLLLFVAMAGTTITPYMQLYLQSAVVERGATVADLQHESNEAVGGAVFADLIAAFIILATGATPVGGGHPPGGRGGGGGEGAGAVRRPVRGAPLRHRPARRQPARRGDPADRHLLRRRREPRLRKRDRPAARRGAGLHRPDHGDDPDLDPGRDGPRRAGDLAAGRGPGGQRAAPADQPLLCVAAGPQRGADGGAPQQGRGRLGDGGDRGDHLDPQPDPRRGDRAGPVSRRRGSVPPVRTVARLENGEDAARGRAARRTTPRSSHAHWAPAADREDPIAILRRQAEPRGAAPP